MPLRQAAPNECDSSCNTAPRVLPGPYSTGPGNRCRLHALGGATLLRRRPRSGLRRTACELVQQQAANAARRAFRPGVRPARTEKTRRAHLRQPGGAVRRRTYDHPVGLGDETLAIVASCARSVIGKLQNRGRLVRAGRFTRKRHVPTPMYVVGARPSGRVRERRQPKWCRDVQANPRDTPPVVIVMHSKSAPRGSGFYGRSPGSRVDTAVWPSRR